MATATTIPAARDGDPATGDALGLVETELAMLTRTLEGMSRRSTLYQELDRASYVLARTLVTAAPVSINGLAELVGLDATTVTRQVATMETAGLVRRKRHATDRRISLVELTAQPGFHVLAGPGPRLDEPGLAARVDVHRLARTPGRYLLGLRPDGYLGFCGGRTMSRDSALGSPAQAAPRPRSISADRRFSSRARARSRCRVAGSGIEHTTALIMDLGENVAGFGSWSRSGPVNSRPPSTRC